MVLRLRLALIIHVNFDNGSQSLWQSPDAHWLYFNVGLWPHLWLGVILVRSSGSI